MKTNVLAHGKGQILQHIEGSADSYGYYKNYHIKLVKWKKIKNHYANRRRLQITEHGIVICVHVRLLSNYSIIMVPVYRKNVEKCIQLIKPLLRSEKYGRWWNPLYYRYVDTVQGRKVFQALK